MLLISMQINPHESIKFFNEPHLKISAPAKPEDEDDKLKGNDKLKCDHDNYQLLESIWSYVERYSTARSLHITVLGLTLTSCN